MSFQPYSVWVLPSFFSGQRPRLRSRSRFYLIAFILLSVTLLLTLLNSPARAAGPCTCKDLDKIKAHVDRVAASEEAWKEIFAWARELYPGVALPQSNDDLNQKFVQLASTPKSQWRDLVKEGPAKLKTALKKVAGLDEKGEPVVDDEFKKTNCDDVIEAEKEHERRHHEFYKSFPKVFEVVMESRLLRLRSESEVESYRAQKNFLEQKLVELKLKCITTLDKSGKLLLQEEVAQRERLNQAETRIRLLGTAQPGK